MENIGILALAPPIIAIALAMITKQVIVSLFAGIFIGATLNAGFNPIVGIYDSFSEYIFPSMGDSYNASVIFMALFCGSFALLLEKNGGAHAFAQVLNKRVKTPKGAQLLATAGGTAIFFSDSSNPVLVGPIFKPITDSLRVSREKLAYICDATTATMPSMFFFTAWGAYIISIITQQLSDSGSTANALTEFVRAVPFSYYTIAAVVMVYVFAITGFDFGPMRKAEVRAQTTGKLLADEDITENLIRKMETPPEGSKPTIWNMLLPLIVMIIVIFAGFMWTGGFPGVGVLEALGNASSMKCLVMGFFVGSVLAAIMGVTSKVLTGKRASEVFFSGIRMMMDPILIKTDIKPPPMVGRME